MAECDEDEFLFLLAFLCFQRLLTFLFFFLSELSGDVLCYSLKKGCSLLTLSVMMLEIVTILVFSLLGLVIELLSEWTFSLVMKSLIHASDVFLNKCNYYL